MRSEPGAGQDATEEVDVPFGDVAGDLARARSSTPADDPDADLRHVMALEIELQQPAARADRQRLTQLLAPDFEEVGASGRVWDRADTIDLLAGPRPQSAPPDSQPAPPDSQPTPPDPQRCAAFVPVADAGFSPVADDAIEVHDLTGTVLADGVIALRWDSLRGAGTARERRSRRTSLWRRDPEGWRLVRHQGTVLE